MVLGTALVRDEGRARFLHGRDGPVARHDTVGRGTRMGVRISASRRAQLQICLIPEQHLPSLSGSFPGQRRSIAAERQRFRW
jgi:hypothetical protein